MNKDLEKDNNDVEMLTVKKLIEYLKTQDPNAHILAYDMYSDAYVSQFPNLPNTHIQTVQQEKIDAKNRLSSIFKDFDATKYGFNSPDEFIDSKIEELFRYAKDNDVIISIGN